MADLLNVLSLSHFLSHQKSGNNHLNGPGVWPQGSLHISSLNHSFSDQFELPKTPKTKAVALLITIFALVFMF